MAPKFELHQIVPETRTITKSNDELGKVLVETSSTGLVRTVALTTDKKTPPAPPVESPWPMTVNPPQGSPYGN